MATDTLTPEQGRALGDIATLAKELFAEEALTKAKRAKLTAMMINAKDNLDISSYSIASAIDLSQPRVMQIIKAAKARAAKAAST